MRAHFSKVVAPVVGIGALAACGTQIGAEAEDMGLNCEIVRSTVLPDTSAVPEGFDESVDDVLVRLTGAFTGTITSHGEEVEYGYATAPPNALTLGAPVTLTVTQAGADVVLDEYESDEGACGSRWSVPVTVGLVVDGELDEQATGTLVVSPDNEAGIYDVFVPLAELQGPAAPGPAIAASPEARLDIHAYEWDGGWAGSLSFLSDERPTDENGVDPDTFEQELLGEYEVD